MKRLCIGLALLCSAAAAGAQAVDAGRGDWDRFPAAQDSGRRYLSAAAMDRIEEIARQGACRVPGLRRYPVDLSVPFVLRFNAAGSVERIVVRDLGCPELERLLGGALQEMAAAGEYRPTRGPGWYRSSIEFANR